MTFKIKMEIKKDIKLTANKSNQINISDSLDSIYSNRKTIKIKSKQKLFLSEEQNNIKDAHSIKYIRFPKIKNDIIYNIKQSPQNLNINNSFINNYQTLDKSISNKRNFIINPDYIKLNSLFFYPKIANKRNLPHKLYFSNSIDVPKSRPSLLHTKLKKLKLNNISKNNNSKIYMIKNNNKKIKKEYYEIYNFMKMKYYEDTKAKMEKQLKDDSFIDIKDKDKLIQIGKFNIFWKNVLDYCKGYIFSQRIKDKKKMSLNNSKEVNKSKIKLKKTPNNRIYTSILRAKLIHYKNSL